MSNYNSLKATIDANIKQNGRQEITGQILNSVLNQMVTTLGAGYQFAGVATTATNPGSPDAKVFYIANGKGTYNNFGSVEVTEDEVVVLYWDSSWHKVSTGIASQEKLTELGQEATQLSQKLGLVIDGVADSKMPVNEILGITKLAGYNGGVESSYVQISQFVGFDTYYLIAFEPCDIYFDTLDSAYVALSYGEDYSGMDVHPTTIQLFCTNTVRYRNTENNLPSVNNKLHLSKNCVIAITLTADTMSDIYGFTKYVASESFKDEVIGDLDDRVVGAENELGEIFENATIGVNISNITGVVNDAGYNGGPNGTTKITLAKNNDYDSYYLIADKEMDVYFGKISSAYVAITIGNNYTGRTNYTTSIDLFCSNPVRYRNTDGNLPSVSNKLHVGVGDIIQITITAGGDDLIYGIEEMQVVRKSFANQISKKCSAKYISGAGEQLSVGRLEIIVPSGEKYIKYNFFHSVSNGANADIWRMGTAFLLDWKLNTIEQLVIDGEWEVALKLDGRSDFSGGIAHGDEVYKNIVFFFDGVEVDVTSLTETITFDTLEIFENSILYDPAKGSTLNDDEETKVKIANHGSKHIISESGVVIKQTVDWLVNEDTADCYMAMFPVKKSVADKMIFDSDYTPQNITYGFYSGVKHSTLFKENGRMVGFGIPVFPQNNLYGNGQFLITDNGGYNYHKQYFIVCRSGSVTSGEKWVSEAIYNV